MALAKVQLIPGFDKQLTETGAEGRWVDGENVRFRYGLPEKIGGWEQLGSNTLVGVARDQHTWFDLKGNKYAAIGTNKILYIYYEGAFYDIHPLEASRQQSLTNAFTTTNSSNIVTVSCPSSTSLNVGDLVVFSGVSGIPGTSAFTAADFTATFEVKTTPTTTSFTIQMPKTEGASTAFSTTGTATLDFYFVVGNKTQVPGFGWGTGYWSGTTLNPATTTMNNGGVLAAGHTTSVTLTNATSFPNSGTVLIGTELITYANKAGNVLQTLGRGAQGTTDATHADGSLVTDVV